MIGHSSRTGKLMGVDHRWNVHAARWLVAAVALTAFVGVSAAQTPQPKAQPKAAPKAAQPAAPAEPRALVPVSGELPGPRGVVGSSRLPKNGP